MSIRKFSKNLLSNFKNVFVDFKHKRVLIISLGFFTAFILILSVFPKASKPVEIKETTKSQADNIKEEFSTFGKNVNENIFIKDVEKQLSDMNNRYEEQKEAVKQLTDHESFLADYIGKLESGLKKIDERLAKIETNQTMVSLQNQISPQQQKSDIELEYVKIMPIEKNNENDKQVRLPIGSYAQGTLLTGVYAPVDSSNPLPVLIRLDEAFVGPNNSRVPLKGTFLIGKAYGDITTHRALIQIVSISTVLPDGRAFEKEGSYGYVTDNAHLFGLPGIYVENTGKQLGVSFISGFMSGASQAFADAETTSIVGAEGQVSRVVTGNSTKNATFQGLASSASQLSEYYQKQLEKIVPAVQIEPGKTVYFYVQKGVTIEGLRKSDNLTVQYID